MDRSFLAGVSVSQSQVPGNDQILQALFRPWAKAPGLQEPSFVFSESFGVPNGWIHAYHLP